VVEQSVPEPMTIDEVGERYTNKWILMDVTECDARDAPVAGIVLAIGRKEADIQEATMKALREPNLHSQGTIPSARTRGGRHDRSDNPSGRPPWHQEEIALPSTGIATGTAFCSNRAGPILRSSGTYCRTGSSSC